MTGSNVGVRGIADGPVSEWLAANLRVIDRILKLRYNNYSRPYLCV